MNTGWDVVAHTYNPSIRRLKQEDHEFEVLSQNKEREREKDGVEKGREGKMNIEALVENLCPCLFQPIEATYVL
jgi:hypothetical protein